MDYDKLLMMARQAMENAYCPYSKYRVGAALLTEDGRVYTGCNVENASYGATICAERTAAVKAVSEGSVRFKAIAIVSSSGDKTFPCGVCRQFLSEFMCRDGVVVVEDSQGYYTYEFASLLPEQFVL